MASHVGSLNSVASISQAMATMAIGDGNTAVAPAAAPVVAPEKSAGEKWLDSVAQKVVLMIAKYFTDATKVTVETFQANPAGVCSEPLYTGVYNGRLYIFKPRELCAGSIMEHLEQAEGALTDRERAVYNPLLSKTLTLLRGTVAEELIVCAEVYSHGKTPQAVNDHVPCAIDIRRAEIVRTAVLTLARLAVARATK